MNKTSEVFDFKKKYKSLFSPKVQKPQFVDVPPFKYLKIKGQGNPGISQEFSDKTQALYGLAYTMKFMFKKDENDPFDFKVAPLSGLWYAKDMAVFTDGRREEWQWTLMIIQPDRVTNEILQKAKEIMAGKKKNTPNTDQVILEIYKEGVCAQIMHKGPYKDEGPTVKILHDYINEQGYNKCGMHHEIYLGDPRRSKPENLKTIIRQQVTKE